jgi:hypothetical protein
MDQRERADKIEPALAAEPIENAEASEPTDPIDRIEPAEPIDRIEPADPIDKIDPLDPMLKMEPEDPGERDELAEIRITTFWQAATRYSHHGPGDRPAGAASTCAATRTDRRHRGQLTRTSPPAPGTAWCPPMSVFVIFPGSGAWVTMAATRQGRRKGQSLVPHDVKAPSHRRDVEVPLQAFGGRVGMPRLVVNQG